MWPSDIRRFGNYCHFIDNACAFQFMCKRIAVKLFCILRVLELSNSKNDLEYYSRSLLFVPYDRIKMIFYRASIVNMSLYCTVSQVLLVIPKI